MKILITGGAGMIGSEVAEFALKRGHDVTVYDNLSNGVGDIYISSLDVNLVNGDINDREFLSHNMRDTEVVFHLAAQGNVVNSISDPVSNFTANVGGTLNVLEAMRENSIKHIIFSSTAGALMGNTTPPVTEFSIPDPISPYGASKGASELYIKAYSASYGIDYTIYRFGNVLGRNCFHKNGVLNQFIKKIVNKTDIEIFGNPSRDLIFATDIADIMAASIKLKKSRNQIFHLSSNQETSIHELAKKLMTLLGITDIEIKFAPERIGEVVRNFSASTKANDLLAFTPENTVDEMLLKIIPSLKRHYETHHEVHE